MYLRTCFHCPRNRQKKTHYCCVQLCYLWISNSDSFHNRFGKQSELRHSKNIKGESWKTQFAIPISASRLFRTGPRSDVVLCYMLLPLLSQFPDGTPMHLLPNLTQAFFLLLFFTWASLILGCGNVGRCFFSLFVCQVVFRTTFRVSCMWFITSAFVGV